MLLFSSKLQSMSKVIVWDESKDSADDPWDDTLLIKAYDNSVNLAREELARRISLSTSKNQDPVRVENISMSNSVKSLESRIVYKVGDYVRANFEDGVDYEAKILSIDEVAETCVLKYIGYENVQVVALSDLVASWGKKARRIQFAKAKVETTAANTDGAYPFPLPSAKSSKKNRIEMNMSSMPPPPPPIPPMLTTSHGLEDSEHLSAMLMSWYMSGYYTGVYQGMQMAKTDGKVKK